MAMISSLAFAHQHDALLSDHLLHLRTDMMLRDQISVVVVVVAGDDDDDADDDDDDDDDDDEICLLLMVMMVMTIMGGRSDARAGARSERLALIYGYVAISTLENWGSKHHLDAISNLFGLPLKAMTCQSTSELKLCDLPQAASTCFDFPA